jgi:hypothetical protein
VLNPLNVNGLDAPLDVEGTDDVTVKEEIAAPPVAGAVKATETAPEPVLVAVGALIVAGTVVEVIDPDAEDAVEVPFALVAVTVNV